MLTIIFAAALIWVAWKMLIWGIKATWGIAKITCIAFFVPVFLVGLVCISLLYVAIPIIIVLVIISFAVRLIEA